MTAATLLRPAWAGALLAAACGFATAQSVRPAPAVVAAPAAAPTAGPAIRLVSMPNGMERRLVSAPSTGAANAKAAAASSRVRSAVVNGVSVHVLASQAGATAAARTAGHVASVEHIAPNGQHARVLASTAAPPPHETGEGHTVIDIDPAGHTLKPSDALRHDVLFRRLPALPAR